MSTLLLFILSTLPLSPPAAVQQHFTCCYPRPDAPPLCSKVPAGEECKEGGKLHKCSDTLTCNPDGTACWYDCEPVD